MGLMQYIRDGKAVFVDVANPLPTAGAGSTAPPGTGTTTSVANAITNTTLAAANANRKGLTIFNDAAVPADGSDGTLLRVKFGAGASATSFSVLLRPRGYLEVPYGYTGIVDAIASAAEGNADD